MPKNTRYNAVRVCAIIAILLLNLILYTGEVWAATVVDITVTANPSGLFAPTNFIATTITDNKITLTWTANIFATTTLVMAKTGSYPLTSTDGYQVYNGAAEIANDTSVSLDETATNIYYRAWSVDGVGNKSPDYASSNTGGDGMTLIAFLGFALILTWIASKSSYWILKALAGGTWFFELAYWMYGGRPTSITQGTPPDQLIVVILFTLGIVMFLMIFWGSRSQNGYEVGGFRLPWQTEEEKPAPIIQTSYDRRVAYENRIADRMNGGRPRRG
jgi:hypothetical protein